MLEHSPASGSCGGTGHRHPYVLRPDMMGPAGTCRESTDSQRGQGQLDVAVSLTSRGRLVPFVACQTGENSPRAHPRPFQLPTGSHTDLPGLPPVTCEGMGWGVPAESGIPFPWLENRQGLPLPCPCPAPPCTHLTEATLSCAPSSGPITSG